MPELQLFDQDRLRSWAHDAFRALGTPDDAADVVAGSLIESDLRGYASHGLMRLPAYADHVQSGRVDPRARPELIDTGGSAMIVVDGHHAFGQLTARAAVDALLERAPRTGIAAAVLRRCTHVGRLGEYVERLADHGIVGSAISSAEPQVVPAGGSMRMLGTNPLAWAVPVPAGTPALVVDFATSGTSAGRIAAAAASGDPIPAGLLLDKHHDPTTDPAALRDGGALMPAAGHKGYGLALVSDLVAGLLSDAGSATSPDFLGSPGMVLTAIHVAGLTDLDRYRREVDDARNRLRASPPQNGVAAVSVPGDGSARIRGERAERGIPFPAATLERLAELADRLGISALG